MKDLLKKVLKLNDNNAEGFFYLLPSERYSGEMDIVTQGTTKNIENIIKRIFDYYHLTVEFHQKDFKTSIWRDFFKNLHADIHQILMDKDEEKLKEIFANPYATKLFYGFDSYDINIDKQSLNIHKGGEISLLDGLYRFACAIEAQKLEVPENPDFLTKHNNGWFKKITSDLLVNRIEETLEKDITFPTPFIQELGVKTPKGIASYRAIQALYQAWRIKELTKDIKNPKVLEIGAGMGRTAFYAHQLFDIKDYTLVDLPFTNVSQALFLSTTLDEDDVVLLGENFENSNNKIKILPPQEFFNNPQKYDLIVNVDSITEMNIETAQKYWDLIEKYSDKFLSINREINAFTTKTLRKNSTKIKSLAKYPYWMRPGYSEEVVEFKD